MRYSILHFTALIICALLTGCKEPITPVVPPEPEKPTTDWIQDKDSSEKIEGIALLDLTTRNGEVESGSDNGRNLYSAEYILEIAGAPFFTTKDLNKALSESKMILFSSPVRNVTFTQEEVTTISDWVKDGGVIIAPACIEQSYEISQLFGITAASYNKSRYFASWEDDQMTDKELEYMDEPEEKDFSLGNAKLGESVKTYGYTISTAIPLARFNDGDVAISSNKFGEGRVYSFGFLWRDVIQRSQLNKDFSAQRSYSNDFEPSADAFPLFVRSVYNKYNQVSVWKSTIPDGFESVLIPTHDCDSRTAYEQMHYMSDYEKAIGLKAHYFLTTHYFKDSPYLSDFYDAAAIKESKKLLEAGHTVGSHSICHFPDFSKTNLFPNTVVTKESYRAHHDPTTGVSSNGSTWAEVVLSKKILEEDLGNKVRSFRTGHLAMNKNIPEMLKVGQYSFSSCYGAGDVLTCFPYLERLSNDWTGAHTGVLQMPLHFSDVINDDPMNEKNWSEKSERWLKIINKLAGNYAPSMLLIHPNRDWKMKAEKQLVEIMDLNKIGLYNFEDYGDFWLARREFKFEYGYDKSEGRVIIRSTRKEFEKNPHICFMVEIETGQKLSEVVLMDENSFSRKLRIKNVAHDKYMAY